MVAHVLFVQGRIRVFAMIQQFRNFAKLLMKTATQGNIEFLKSTAYSKKRYSCLNNSRDQVEHRGIAVGVVFVVWPNIGVGAIFLLVGISAVITGIMWTVLSFSLRKAPERIASTMTTLSSPSQRSISSEQSPTSLVR